MNKCRVLLGSGEPCKKRAAQDSANLQHSRKLDMFNNCQLIRPTQTALQCLIDHRIIVWILQDTAGKKATDEIFSFYRKKLNKCCLHLESVPRMPLISGMVPVAPAVLPGGMARVNRHNLQKPRLL
jgi:hypothetical protein